MFFFVLGFSDEHRFFFRYTLEKTVIDYDLNFKLGSGRNSAKS